MGDIQVFRSLEDNLSFFGLCICVCICVGISVSLILSIENDKEDGSVSI